MKTSLFAKLLFTLCPALMMAEPMASDAVKPIVSYLSEHSLYPVLSGGNTEYTHLGFDEKSDAFAFGNIHQGELSYTTLFLIEWQEYPKAHLLYLTTDTPISPLLFFDILTSALNFLPPTLGDFHVLIEKSKELPDHTTQQKWTFFNPDESAALDVLLSDDGKGGTYFTIQNRDV